MKPAIQRPSRDLHRNDTNSTPPLGLTVRLIGIFRQYRARIFRQIGIWRKFLLQWRFQHLRKTTGIADACADQAFHYHAPVSICPANGLESDSILSLVPSTRFQGSKRKILPWIWESIQKLEFTTVLDAFGGTGSVSYLFKLFGKSVTFNDHLRFNYLTGRALVENDNILLTDEEIEKLTRPLSKTKPGFVSRVFRGKYFTDTENRWIDASIERISEIEGEGVGTQFKQALAFHALCQTCLVKRPFNLFHRENLYLRQAIVERGFGNKATWDVRFSCHFRAFLEEARSKVFKGETKCSTLNCDALSIPRTDFDLVYLDPPYLREASHNETADYLHCYHFLEGLARYNQWPELISGLGCKATLDLPVDNRWSRLGENVAAFEALFDKFSNSKIVISYKKFGSPSIQTLKRLLERRGWQVAVKSRHYSYALNQQNGSAKLNRECLLIAT
jgi:adenine-specific DNA methylase